MAGHGVRRNPIQCLRCNTRVRILSSSTVSIESMNLLRVAVNVRARRHLCIVMHVPLHTSSLHFPSRCQRHWWNHSHMRLGTSAVKRHRPEEKYHGRVSKATFASIYLGLLRKTCVCRTGCVSSHVTSSVTCPRCTVCDAARKERAQSPGSSSRSSCRAAWSWHLPMPVFFLHCHGLLHS